MKLCTSLLLPEHVQIGYTDILAFPCLSCVSAIHLEKQTKIVLYTAPALRSIYCYSGNFSSKHHVTKNWPFLFTNFFRLPNGRLF